MAPVLGYWDIRGLAQPIRLFLKYIGEEFEEKLYSLGQAPDYNADCWMGVKSSLGLSLPNLPYWIDGDTKITQSHAILKHLARKHNMCPSSEAETIRSDMVEHLLQDYFMSLAYVCYSSFLKMGDFESLKEQHVASLPDKLKQLSEFLGTQRWFAGENVTFVDFIAYDVLDIHRLFAPGCLDPFKNLSEYQTRFEALPAIQKYMQSDKFIKKPIFNKMADWRGD